jgi:hypothetical protein
MALSPRDSKSANKAAYVGNFSKTNMGLSPRDSGCVGRELESPIQQQELVTYEAALQNSGGPYSGPLLADIEKSIMEAHRGSVARKRKSRDGTHVNHEGELAIVLAKNNEDGDDAVLGVTKRGRMGDDETKTFNGSGLAEAGV